MNPPSAPAAAPTALAPWQLDMYVGAEADGEATPEQLAVLEADKLAWRSALSRLLRDAEEHLASARTLQGEERAQVVADLESEHRRLAAAWKRLTVGPERAAREQDDDLDDDEVLAPGKVQLQVSWEPGRVVAWAAGPATPLAPADDVTAMLTAAGAPASGWIPHAPVPVPGVSGNAEAFGIPVGEVLGWLVAAGAGEAGDDIAPSVRWLGRVAIWAVELTARGAMVPLLRQRKRGSGNSNESNASYSVRWTPALIEPARLAAMVSVMPRAVLALIRRSTPARSPARRSPAWSTRSAATARAGSKCPRRRHASVPPPTSPRPSSPGSTAARSTRPSGSAVRSRPGSNVGVVRSRASTRAWSCGSIRPTRATRGGSRCSQPDATSSSCPSSRRSSTPVPNVATSRTRSLGSNGCCPR